MKIIKFITILSIVSLIYCQTQPINSAQAFEFEPNDIINDNELTDYNSMSLADIQEFLDNQPGVLKSLQTMDTLGNEKTAAEIIHIAALTYIINPKWIIATLQKEQSLITNPTPGQKDLDWAMGYAICDSCSKDDPALQKFKGFGMQIDRATARIRYYFDHPNDFGIKVGYMYNIDGRDVLPFNQATANLFIYTPHLHGNYNFWIIWNRWFSKIFPDGTLVRMSGDAGVWLIQNGKRRPFLTKTALMSRYDSTKIIEISRNDLLRYEIGYPLKYPNYSLLKSPAGIIYLLVNDEKKEIESADVFKTIGYNPEEVMEVTDEELSYYQDGRKITLDSIYPQGALVQDIKSGGVFYVEDGIKYPIIAKEILNNNFKNYKLTKLSSEELDKYVKAANGMKLIDGTLIQIKGDNKVYVISNGQKRWIANESTFNQLGYKWVNIITVSDKVAALHGEGEAIDSLTSNDTQIATIN
ncbi:MAG: hypothetical protein NTZ49_00750 [Candidatus Parcubacteria bacterium]|nr:hypothetical protein [Candidatus Parcubacteria bacterium]